jgi:hypothetical protein
VPILLSQLSIHPFVYLSIHPFVHHPFILIHSSIYHLFISSNDTWMLVLKKSQAQHRSLQRWEGVSGAWVGELSPSTFH